MSNLLANKKITIILFLALIPLAIAEGQSRSVPGVVFIAFAVPLVLNLLFCLLRHVKSTKQWDAERCGFILFHIAFLVIIAGGMVTYFTYSVGYVEVVEGEAFQDIRESYSGWVQRFGVRKGTGINVVVGKINMDFWDNGQIRSYDNEIVIKDGGRERSATLQVNGSVSHGGLLINLARYYGLAPHFVLASPGRKEAGYVYVSDTKKINDFRIPGTNIRATVSYKDFNDRKLKIKIQPDLQRTIETTISPGDVIDLGEAKLTLTGIHVWNGLTVVTDSGKGITYTGFILFMFGLCMYYWKKLPR